MLRFLLQLDRSPPTAPIRRLTMSCLVPWKPSLLPASKTLVLFLALALALVLVMDLVMARLLALVLAVLVLAADLVMALMTNLVVTPVLALAMLLAMPLLLLLQAICSATTVTDCFAVVRRSLRTCEAVCPFWWLHRTTRLGAAPRATSSQGMNLI